ncbi:hypothetical protein NLI96_g11971 [Meripilus lineatus]|uniref:Aminoglycoside phosphotransferase domain-containing protein n=1 Tax=Meripilus lineatus TaxID=2056292 RepID=A0AAD5YCX2_9APHY|nr:hypothetical protein NLI96_g11971 [Physisporinus lineatus]
MVGPLFPTSDAFPVGYPLRCPPAQQFSSPLRAKFWFYVHDWILKPISIYYSGYYRLPESMGIYPLPFGLILKSHEGVREQEAVAMNLARAMGIPAPRALTYGSINDPETFPSILMTRLPGKDISSCDGVNLDVVCEDLIRILTLMRAFSSPWGNMVCGVDGGPLSGPHVPNSLLPATANEADFQQQFRDVASFSSARQQNKHKDSIAATEEFFSLPPHAIVFTHGDLQWHNIMVTPDSHISGIVDWEAAGWLPDYWEFSILGLRKGPWNRVINEGLTSNVYEKQVTGHRHLLRVINRLLPLYAHPSIVITANMLTVSMCVAASCDCWPIAECQALALVHYMVVLEKDSSINDACCLLQLGFPFPFVVFFCPFRGSNFQPE